MLPGSTGPAGLRVCWRRFRSSQVPRGGWLGVRHVAAAYSCCRVDWRHVDM